MPSGMTSCFSGPRVSVAVPLPAFPSDGADVYVIERFTGVVRRFASVISVPKRTPPTPAASSTMGRTFVTTDTGGRTMSVSSFRLLEPWAFVATRSTSNWPGEEKVCVGLWAVEDDVSPKVHDQDVGAPEE